MATNTPAQSTCTYGRAARAFHWITFGLVAIQWPVGLYMSHRGNELKIWDATTNALYSSHKLLGVVILLVVVCRLAWRLVHGAPPDEPTITRWQSVASHLNHWGLYLVLLALPVMGYIGVARYPALEILPGFSLPALLAPDQAAAATAFHWHAVLAMALAGLVTVHVAAALYHFLVRRDGVLGRMWPARRKR